jgi:hypothetical protein
MGNSDEKESYYFVNQEIIIKFVPSKKTAARLSYHNYPAALIFIKL